MVVFETKQFRRPDFYATGFAHGPLQIVAAHFVKQFLEVETLVQRTLQYVPAFRSHPVAQGLEGVETKQFRSPGLDATGLVHGPLQVVARHFVKQFLEVEILVQRAFQNVLAFLGPGKQRFPGLLLADEWAGRPQNGPHDRVVELAHIARPGMVHHNLFCGIGKLFTLGLPLRRKPLVGFVERGVEQPVDVFGPAFFERRQFEAEDGQPVKEVLAKILSRDLMDEVAVGRGDDADVDWPGFRLAHAGHGAFLNRPEQGDLGLVGEFAHFVQKQRAAIGRLKNAVAGPVGPGEGPTDVAEKVGFDEIGGNGPAVHRHERSLRTGACLVNSPREQFLARAGFPFDEDGHVPRRRVLGASDDGAHGVAGEEDVLKSGVHGRGREGELRQFPVGQKIGRYFKGKVDLLNAVLAGRFDDPRPEDRGQQEPAQRHSGRAGADVEGERRVRLVLLQFTHNVPRRAVNFAVRGGAAQVNLPDFGADAAFPQYPFRKMGNTFRRVVVEEEGLVELVSSERLCDGAKVVRLVVFRAIEVSFADPT